MWTSKHLRAKWESFISNREIALLYSINGWLVLPLYEPQGSACSYGLECGKLGKHPRVPKWQEASCDPDTVAGWWTQWPDANIGLRLDGLLVLDLDGPEGADSLAALEQQHGMLIAGAQQRSGSGGWHYVFLAVEGLGKRIRFKPGLDLLTGAGCYIVVEPSSHASGGTYQWLGKQSPLTAHRNELPLTVPPGWLVAAAANRKPKTTARPARATAERVPVERIMAVALQKVQSGMGRNDAGLYLFAQLRDNQYSKDEALLALREWVVKANEATPGQDRYSQREADATLRSAYKRDARDPWAESDKPSQADTLLKLIDDFEYFKSGPANDAYVRMVIGDHREVWKVDAKGPKVREVLTHRFLTQKDREPGREALNVVLDTILARCSMGPKVDVHVRFARSRDVIYLDLCDDQWKAVQITADGWQVVKEPPVLFRRGAGARPLPVPVNGGTLDPLRALLNAGDNSQWCLMMSWLVGVFLPEGAFSHLVLNGEQGSAKSTTALVLLSMLDPSDAGLSAPPKDETDATVMRGDLLERSITLKLPLVTSKTRLTEQGIWADFAAMHPACLGALLDAVSAGLRNLPTTTLTDAPRMSDFCRWIVASESALPWKQGTFLTAYRSKMQDANTDLAEDDSVACAMLDWADSNLRPGASLELVAKTLLVQLNDVMRDCPKDIRHWPVSPGALAHKLVRLAPVLRAQGVEVRKLRRTGKARSRWEITRTGTQLPLLIEQDALKIAA